MGGCNYSRHAQLSEGNQLVPSALIVPSPGPLHAFPSAPSRLNVPPSRIRDDGTVSSPKVSIQTPGDTLTVVPLGVSGKYTPSSPISAVSAQPLSQGSVPQITTIQRTVNTESLKFLRSCNNFLIAAYQSSIVVFSLTSDERFNLDVTKYAIYDVNGTKQQGFRATSHLEITALSTCSIGMETFVISGHASGSVFVWWIPNNPKERMLMPSLGVICMRDILSPITSIDNAGEDDSSRKFAVASDQRKVNIWRITYKSHPTPPGHSPRVHSSIMEPVTVSLTKELRCESSTATIRTVHFRDRRVLLGCVLDGTIGSICRWAIDKEPASFGTVVSATGAYQSVNITRPSPTLHSLASNDGRSSPLQHETKKFVIKGSRPTSGPVSFFVATSETGFWVIDQESGKQSQYRAGCRVLDTQAEGLVVVLLTDDNILRVVNLEDIQIARFISSKQVSEFKLKCAMITAVAINRKFIAVGGSGGQVYLFRRALPLSSMDYIELASHPSAVTSLLFTDTNLHVCSTILISYDLSAIPLNPSPSHSPVLSSPKVLDVRMASITDGTSYRS